MPDQPSKKHEREIELIELRRQNAALVKTLRALSKKWRDSMWEDETIYGEKFIVNKEARKYANALDKVLAPYAPADAPGKEQKE